MKKEEIRHKTNEKEKSACVTRATSSNPLSLQHPPQNLRKHPSDRNIFKNMYTLWEDFDEGFSGLRRFIFTDLEEVKGTAVRSGDGEFGMCEFELDEGWGEMR